MAPDPDAIWLLANQVLAAVENGYGADGVEMPDRRYVSSGLVAFDCLVGDTLVSTPDGPTRIEDVRPGDLVYDWTDGDLTTHLVTAWMAKGNRPIMKVRTGHRTIRATANHRVLTLAPAPGPRQPRRELVATWKHVGDLTTADLLVVNASLPEQTEDRYFPDGLRIDERLAWLLGVFIGDGSVTPSGLDIAVYGELRERVAATVEELWGLSSRHHPAHGLKVFSHRVRDAFKDAGLRVTSSERTIPVFMWRLPAKTQRAFLDGYAAADGHRRPNGYIAYALASPRLAAELRAMHIGLGDTVDNIHIEKRTKPIVIKGKTVKRALPLHRFRVYPAPYRLPNDPGHLLGRGRVLMDGTAFTVERVRAVTDDGYAPTFDISVEGSANFIADGVVVHNCEQIVVQVESTYGIEGDVTAEVPRSHLAHAGHALRGANAVVWVIRCAAPIQEASGMPTVADEEDAAQLVLGDCQRVLNYLVAAQRAGDLGSCNNVVYDRWEGVGPEGGMVGGVTRVRLGIGF